MGHEKISVELNSEFIETIFNLANMQIPEKITEKDLDKALSSIKIKINEKDLFVNPSNINKTSDLENIKINNLTQIKRVLIVDDLGIITYQLDILFKKMGFEVIISQEIYDAIDKYKKQDFGYAVIDLFIPTEREGFMLLDELKKLSLLCKLNTRIIVMTASSKPEFYTKCINRGADFYIEKSAGWQKAITEACMSVK